MCCITVHLGTTTFNASEFTMPAISLMCCLFAGSMALNFLETIQVERHLIMITILRSRRVRDLPFQIEGSLNFHIYIYMYVFSNSNWVIIDLIVLGLCLIDIK